MFFAHFWTCEWHYKAPESTKKIQRKLKLIVNYHQSNKQVWIYTRNMLKKRLLQKIIVDRKTIESATATKISTIKLSLIRTTATAIHLFIKKKKNQERPHHFPPIH